MRTLVLAAILVGVCSLSCDDDPGPQGLVTYTLEVDGDWWLFASSKDGKVLDSKQLKFKEPVSLATSQPIDSFSITLVRVQRSYPLSLEIRTYMGMTPGSVFTPKLFYPEQVERPEQDGKITVQIVNYPVEQAMPLIVADQYQSTSSNSSGSGTRTFLMNAWKSQAPRFLITAYDGDLSHPVYKYVDGSSSGETITADFTTFLPFEKTIDVKGFNTQGIASVGFTMYSALNADVTGIQFAEVGWEYEGVSPVAKVGYLDDFTNYYFDLRIYEFFDGATLRAVHKLIHNGPITKPITVFHNHLTVDEGSMTDFDFTITGDYQMRSQVYYYSSQYTEVSWTIYSPPGTPWKVVDIPDELLSAYPAMIPGNMTYQGSRFYHYDDGYSYGNFIDDTFTNSYGPMHPGYEEAFPDF